MALKTLKNQIIELLVFICLILAGFKLSGSIIAINWSWWIVFSPLSVLVVNYMIIGALVLNKLYYSVVPLKMGRKEIES